MRKRVVIVGGAGVFGARLVKLLAGDKSFDLVIAGRDLNKARDAAHAIGASAAVIDRDLVTANELLALNCDALVDCSGPFHIDGKEPYRLVAATLNAGAHYLDIADGRDFVCGIGSLDDLAQQKGRFALSGASTTPALSSAVVDVLAQRFTRIDRLEIGVTPGNRAPRGLAVIRSILSYAGRPVRVFQNGSWGQAPGWGLLTRKDLAPDLRGRWLSLCDTPDLELFPGRYRVLNHVLFRGGLELGVLHLGLTAASQLVRFKVLPSLSLLSEMARDLADILIDFGTDSGGMIVEISGRDHAGSAGECTWTLVAEGGDGPNIPVLAAFACLKKMDVIPPGARPCMGDVSLAEFEELFDIFRIRTNTR